MRCIPTFLIGVGLSVWPQGGASTESDRQCEEPKSAYACLDRKAANEDGGREHASLVRALEQFFGGPARRTALTWLGEHEAGLSAITIEALYQSYVDQNPSDAATPGLREQLALRRLERSPREEREAIYRSAVQNGRALIAEGVTLTRVRALRRAAAEGIEGFLDDLGRFEGEIDAGNVFQDAKTADVYRWAMLLARGAKDRSDASRLRTQRLSEQSPGEFVGRMDTDPGFREAVLIHLQDGCVGRDRPLCLNVFRRLTSDVSPERARDAAGVEPLKGVWRDRVARAVGE